MKKIRIEGSGHPFETKVFMDGIDISSNVESVNVEYSGRHGLVRLSIVGILEQGKDSIVDLSIREIENKDK